MKTAILIAALMTLLLPTLTGCTSQIEAAKSSSLVTDNGNAPHAPEPSDPNPVDPDPVDPDPVDPDPMDPGPTHPGEAFTPPFTPLRTLTVCASGCTHTSVSAAVAASREYDLIEVHGGTYNDCAAINTNNLWLKGVNGRPHLKDRVCQSKGIFVTHGRNIIIENFELSGMQISESLGNNAAGIRGQGQELHVRNVYFHDGQNGILGGGRPNDGIVTITNSHFARLGYGGYEHLIYIDKVQSLTVKNSVFEQGLRGNMLKSRALASQITCNQLVGGVSSQYAKDGYAINLPNGGDHLVENNTVVQGPHSNQRTLIDFGSEGLHSGTIHRFIVRNNHLINEHTTGTFVMMFGAAAHGGTLTGNKIVGPGTVVGGAGASSMAQSSNSTFANRSAAGLNNNNRPAACTGPLGLINNP